MRSSSIVILVEPAAEVDLGLDPLVLVTMVRTIDPFDDEVAGGGVETLRAFCPDWADGLNTPRP